MDTIAFMDISQKHICGISINDKKSFLSVKTVLVSNKYGKTENFMVAWGRKDKCRQIKHLDVLETPTVKNQLEEIS